MLLPLASLAINAITPPLQFAVWYCNTKFRERKHECNVVELEVIAREKPSSLPLNFIVGGSSPIQDRFLTNEDAVFLLAPYLHYADIVNLGLTSKSIYEIVFATNAELILSHSPPGPLGNQRRRTLKTQSCRPKHKDSCWFCGFQICRGCTTAWYEDEPKTTKHLERCSPYCSRCYYSLICKREEVSLSRHLGKLWTRKRFSCKCKPLNNKRRKYCRHCGTASVDLTAKREAIEQRKMKALRAVGLNCAGCGRLMPGDDSHGALRWWRCNTCGNACSHDCHRR